MKKAIFVIYDFIDFLCSGHKCVNSDCQRTIKGRLRREGMCEMGTVRVPFHVESPAHRQLKGGFCPFDSAGENACRLFLPAELTQIRQLGYTNYKLRKGRDMSGTNSIYKNWVSGYGCRKFFPFWIQ